MRGLHLALVSLTALGLPIIPAFADQVVLTNGRTLEGIAKRLDNGDVELTSSVGSIILPGGRIAEVRTAPTVEEWIDEQLDDAAKHDAELYYDLALEAYERGATTLARRLWTSALDLDPTHQPSHRALGHVRVEDQWLSEEDAHRARGEVLYQGQWVTRRERADLIQTETAEALQRLQMAQALGQIIGDREPAAPQPAATPSMWWWGGPVYPVYPVHPIEPPHRPGGPTRPAPKPTPMPTPPGANRGGMQPLPRPVAPPL